MLKLIKVVVFSSVGWLLTGQAQAAKFQYKVSEKYQEKVVCVSGCSEVATGLVSAQCKFPFGTDMAFVDEDTTFSMRFANLTYQVRLGDSPDYAPGATKLSFRFVASGPGKSVLLSTLKLSWKNGIISAKLKAVTPEANSSGVAQSLVGQPVGQVSVDTEGHLGFFDGPDNLTIGGPMEVFGTIKRNTKTVDGTPYELDTIKVKSLVDLSIS